MLFMPMIASLPGEVVVESPPGKAEAVDRFMQVEAVLELIKEHIGESVLGKGSLEIGISEQVEDVVRLDPGTDQSAKVVGVMSPGVDAGEERGSRRCGVVAGSVVVVVDRGGGCKSLQVGAGEAGVAVEREVAG